jgi:Fe-S cluster assembly protein SufB
MAIPNPALEQVPDSYKYGWHDSEQPLPVFKKGLNAEVVAEISRIKDEPEWMTKLRLKAYRHFESRPLPTWGGDMTGIDFQDIYYYVTGTGKSSQSWDDVPDYIRRTYDRLGIPEAEKKYLAGVGGQYDSEVVYHNIKAELEEQGVIFMGTDQGLKEHPELFREYFGTIIPANDNKLAALNTAVWSGGSFIYVPKGVHVELPLQAYFRINTENMGQFERTLIIADEGSYVHYVEGCSAPIYTSDSLHSAVVEIIVKKGARVRYTTIQNWSTNVYNLVTKRAAAHEDAVMEWVDGNIGSKVTMKYPSIYLLGKGARGEVLSVAYAGPGMHTDAGGKAIHVAPYTSSVITSKSVSKGGGRTGYRGLVRVEPGAHHAKSIVRCDALILDADSRSDTYPYVEVDEQTAQLGHEATVSRVGEDQLFSLMSRGLTEAEATAMVVNGFIEPITRELPMEYAVELNRLVELQMEGAIG